MIMKLKARALSTNVLAPTPRLIHTLLGVTLLVSACDSAGGGDKSLDGSVSPIATDGKAPSADGQVALDGATPLDATVTVVDGEVIITPAGDAGSDGQQPATPDASKPDAAVQAAGEPVFMAWGTGGWRAISCDRGRTWKARQESAERNDESEWAAFAGITWAKDTFVAARGWGTGGKLFTIGGADALTLNNANLDFQGGVSHVGYSGTEFVAFGSGRHFRSADGKSWSAPATNQFPSGVQHVRKMRLFADVPGLGIASINNDADARWAIRTSDGGKTWQNTVGDLKSCTDDIQRRGDIVHLNGTLLIVGQHSGVCRSTDQGRNWSAGPSLPSGSNVFELWTDGANYFVLASGKVYRLNGSSWEEQATLNGLYEEGAGAFGKGTHVITDGRKFFYSDDGRKWTEATVSGNSPNAYVRDLAVGYSSSCKLP